MRCSPAIEYYQLITDVPNTHMKICIFFLLEMYHRTQYRQPTNYFNSIWNKILYENERTTHFQCLFPYGWFLFMRYKVITIIADQTVSKSNNMCSHCAEIARKRSLKFNWFFGTFMKVSKHQPLAFRTKNMHSNTLRVCESRIENKNKKNTSLTLGRAVSAMQMQRKRDALLCATLTFDHFCWQVWLYEAYWSMS